ncbi:MAG: peptidoglycan-binding protein [Magnetococcales bacterium]|nr:peptidoglycan-binding protein [Magnetococcales bacterium]
MKKTPQQVFDLCLAQVLKHEGGYCNDAKDPGGETNFGISKRAYPSVDIARLTRERAAEIYRRDYWQKVRGDDLPAAVAMVVFDAAVNQGVPRASSMLQETVGALTDGVIGGETLKALGKKDPASIVQDFMARRACHYANIVSKTPSSSKFLFGWYRRCFAVHQVAMELLES